MPHQPCIYDLHCHLDFAGNGRALAHAAHACGIGALSGTVTPQGYSRALEQFAGLAHVYVGLGLHPWWLADGSCDEKDVERFCGLAPTTRFISEVGLDFAPRRDGTFDLQLAAFTRIAQACAAGGKVVSIHAVHAANAVLDVLERERALDGNVCIFHWFSGSSDELTRAVRAGCWFSLGSRTLSTKRGRAYARAIPRERLLLETDWPDDPVDRLDPKAWPLAWKTELNHATELLAQALQADSIELASQLARNSRRALGLF